MCLGSYNQEVVSKFFFLVIKGFVQNQVPDQLGRLYMDTNSKDALN